VWQDLFENDALVGGGLSALALLAQPLWLVVAVSLTIALRRAGARPVTTMAAALSSSFAMHGGWIAALGLLALGVALATAGSVPLRDRTRPGTGSSLP
jgi:hypothetical protein